MKRQRVNQVWMAIILVSLVSVNVYGQGRGRGGAPQAPQTAKAAAPIEITGYWVSIITEDWRYRMLTPPKGDTVGIPLNAEGRKLAGAWDPDKDEAAGEACKAY